MILRLRRRDEERALFLYQQEIQRLDFLYQQATPAMIMRIQYATEDFRRRNLRETGGAIWNFPLSVTVLNDKINLALDSKGIEFVVID